MVLSAVSKGNIDDFWHKKQWKTKTFPFLPNAISKKSTPTFCMEDLIRNLLLLSIWRALSTKDVELDTSNDRQIQIWDNFKIYGNYWNNLKQIIYKCYYIAIEILNLKHIICNKCYGTNATLHFRFLDLIYAKTINIAR